MLVSGAGPITCKREIQGNKESAWLMLKNQQTSA